MRITIDIEERSLTVEQESFRAKHFLYSREAFELLSKHWLSIGWNLRHWASFSWMGRRLLQLPDDVLRLAEAVWRLAPDVILETGVYDGGSTLLFATLCRMQGRGRVIAIDQSLQPCAREALEHWNETINIIVGDSSSAEVAARSRVGIKPNDRVFVFLDSNHSARHVSLELENYGRMVTPGSYLVVADSNLASLADTPQGDASWKLDNPSSAVDAFLLKNTDFSRERMPTLFQGDADFEELSYFANTWLKRL